jgi:hypothetical protein
MVWLSTKDPRTDRPSKKLDHKSVGHYQALRCHGNACTLNIPTGMSVNPSFHVSKLRKDSDNPLPNQHQEPPPPVTIEDAVEYEVDEVLNAKLLRG